MKHIARTIHLWTGLVFGSLLVLQGLTGSALAWIHELDRMLNPALLHVAPPPGLRAGQPLRLAPAAVQGALEALARDPAYGRPSQLVLPAAAGDVIVASYKPAPGGSPWRQGITRQVMLDPATLRVTGERNWGEPGLSRPLLMPTLFHVHRYLLAGERGKLVVALEGVALALAALSGMVAWWPRASWQALRKALGVRHGGNWPRFSFQLHRSAGFFAAPVLLVSAVSGVQFNKPEWVGAAIGLFGPVTPPGKVANRAGAGPARLAAGQAVQAAQDLFPQGRVSRVLLPASAAQPWELRLRQPGELRAGDGATRVSIDARDGQPLRVLDPLRARGGDRIVAALFPLHTGEAFGLAGRVAMTLAGLLPLGFFVTGLVVWLKLRRKPARAAPGC